MEQQPPKSPNPKVTVEDIKSPNSPKPEPEPQKPPDPDSPQPTSRPKTPVPPNRIHLHYKPIPRFIVRTIPDPRLKKQLFKRPLETEGDTNPNMPKRLEPQNSGLPSSQVNHPSSSTVETQTNETTQETTQPPKQQHFCNQAPITRF